MILYIVKFSACLAVLIVFYKLVLEKESMHVFKRLYLLGALLLSISIPLITFTYYVESNVETISSVNTISEFQPQTSYLPIILMFIYSLGVMLFGYKFIKNLLQLNYKIKHNPKQRSNTITNVLLQDLIVPHTFFNFIFFNRQKFETRKIPKEVIWHEETHAIQKHSIDVLFIEMLHIVFWFNPLIYITKHHIKLNHEFLADQAVLKKGVKTATYQETLLTFSSNAAQPQLASAINYSLIKKRFTVMKTQTSKKGIWLRSILLLPILAILLFSFSSKIIVPEEKYNQIEQELISNQGKATKEQVKEYNALAKKYNDMPEDDMIIKKKDISRLKYLYNLISAEQKKNVESFPNIPHPPKVVEIVEVQSHEVVKVIEVIEIPPNAPEAPKVIEVREIPPPPLPDNPTPEQKRKYIEGYKDAQVVAKVLRLKELVKARELHTAEERNKLKLEKLAYKESKAAAKTLKLKAQKEQLLRVRELRAVEDIKQLKEAKLAYRKDQVSARADKMKADRGKLIEVREIHLKEDKKRLKEVKKAYKKSQAQVKALKNKSKKKEN